MSIEAARDQGEDAREPLPPSDGTRAISSVYSGLDHFTVHGKGYWILILSTVVVGFGRAFWVLYEWFNDWRSFRLPRELYFWLSVFVVFPIAIHVVAGVAEVRLNTKRRKRYAEKSL